MIFKHLIIFFKVGLMYCRNGQQTEEEMYNNEEGGAAFNEFLELIGQKVRLKGFNKYKAGLCNKSKFLFIRYCTKKEMIFSHSRSEKFW